MRPPLLTLLLGAILSMVATGQAQALTCSASMSDINFGSISVRSGVTNSTSGTLQIDCSEALVSVVGACVRIGPGSGGAGGGLSPRYMRRADNAALNYELRPTGNGPAHGTWTSVYVQIPVVLGSGSASLPVYADITSSGTTIGTGVYASTFSGASDIRVDYGVADCTILGQSTVPPDFTVSADVQSSCEVDAASLDFGAVPQTVTNPIDSEGTLNVRCTAATDYTIRLDLGQGPGVTDPANRRMTSGASTLRYGLYQDSGRSAPWGNTPSTDVSSRGMGTNQAFTVYGRIHSGQTPAPGLYSDSVIAIIEY